MQKHLLCDCYTMMHQYKIKIEMNFCCLHLEVFCLYTGGSDIWPLKTPVTLQPALGRGIKQRNCPLWAVLPNMYDLTHTQHYRPKYAAEHEATVSLTDVFPTAASHVQMFRLHTVNTHCVRLKAWSLFYCEKCAGCMN